MESKFKDIYIEKLIQQKVDERGISYAEFARQIHCARTSLYHIFNSKNIDMERLLLISEVLQYNFIEEVYLQKLKSTDENIPCIVIPVKEKGIDTSQLPNELLEWLKQQLLDQSKNRGRQFGSLDNVLQGILYHNNLFMSAR